MYVSPSPSLSRSAPCGASSSYLSNALSATSGVRSMCVPRVVEQTRVALTFIPASIALSTCADDKSNGRPRQPRTRGELLRDRTPPKPIAPSLGFAKQERHRQRCFGAQMPRRVALGFPANTWEKMTGNRQWRRWPDHRACGSWHVEGNRSLARRHVDGDEERWRGSDFLGDSICQCVVHKTMTWRTGSSVWMKRGRRRQEVDRNGMEKKGRWRGLAMASSSSYTGKQGSSSSISQSTSSTALKSAAAADGTSSTDVAIAAWTKAGGEDDISYAQEGDGVKREEGGEGNGGGNGSDNDGGRVNVKWKKNVAGFDYGFQARYWQPSAAVPGNVIQLSLSNFGREWKALRQNILYADYKRITERASSGRGPVVVFGLQVLRGFLEILRGIDKALQLYDALPEIKPAELSGDEDSDELREMLQNLTLSNAAVWEREQSRPPVEAPWIILGPYYALCLMLDVIFNNRPLQRFWFLETVARMPYFSYISMLHLYETLGWWRVGADVRKVHFAEEWNEMHHLKIMESLGGDELWFDRFMGQHAAFIYYWILNLLFLISPKVAYNFSELVEMHAVDTYGQFADENEELLKILPPSPVAVNYYEGEDLYMFDEFQTSRLPNSRRPEVNSLYDVFCNIRDDEGEHVKTMTACQDLMTPVESPNRRKAALGTKTSSSRNP